MIENHVTRSSLTHAGRITNEQSCAECGGTGSQPWDLEDLFGEMNHYVYDLKKRGKSPNFIMCMRVLCRMYQEGQRCNDCNGTGVA